jgi:hypothetical protein
MSLPLSEEESNLLAGHPERRRRVYYNNVQRPRPLLVNNKLKVANMELKIPLAFPDLFSLLSRLLCGQPVHKRRQVKNHIRQVAPADKSHPPGLSDDMD